MFKMQIKPQWGCYPKLSQMAAIQKSTNKNAGEGAEEKEPSYTVSGNANQYNH